MKTQKHTANNDLEIIAACFEKINKGSFILNANFTVEYMSRAYTDITGFLTSDILKKPFEDMINETKNGKKFQEIVSYIGYLGAWHGEVLVHGKTGDALIEMSLAVDINPHGPRAQYRGVFSDITEKRSAEKKLIQSGSHQTLTAPPNPSQFNERIQQMIAGKLECTPGFSVLLSNVLSQISSKKN